MLSALPSAIWLRALDAADVCITIADARAPGRPLLYVNTAFCETTGYSLDEVIGRNCSFLQGADTDRETVRQMAGALDCEHTIDLEVLNYTKAGKPFWNALSISPIYDDHGDLLAFVGFQKDVTDRRTATAEQLHAEKMKALGRFAGGIAHEVNSLLQPVVSLPGLIKDGMPAPMEDEREWLDLIEDSGKSARGLLKSVLSYARKDQEVEAEFCDPVDAVGRAVASLRLQSPDTVHVEAILPPEGQCGQVQGCGESLTSGVVELGRNAMQAMSNSGDLTIAIMALQDRVSITIADTGPGIPDAVRSKIFEPFYTTKPIGQGTGLGLALVHSHISQMGGTLAVETARTGGAVFSITLPVAPAVAAAC